MKKCTLAVTLGDPAGIGPETVFAALPLFLHTHKDACVKLYGPSNVLDSMKLSSDEAQRVECVRQEAFRGALGRPSVESGEASLRALYAAIDACRKGEVQGLVTAPISKEALSMAGSKDVGHTDILARSLGVGPVAMAFITPTLRVVLATVHTPLKDVPGLLSKKKIVEAGGLLDDCLRRYLGIPEPRIAVAGLNPHAGEGGLLGHEEETVIKPAVEILRIAEINASSAVSPDVVFKQAHEGLYDGVIAMYHDQGLIPVKLLYFEKAVNVTLGLSVVRTSPDHGTAYGIAGQGKANPGCMLEAVKTAYAWALAQAVP